MSNAHRDKNAVAASQASLQGNEHHNMSVKVTELLSYDEDQLK
jgi:hypothetical protein